MSFDWLFYNIGALGRLGSQDWGQVQSEFVLRLALLFSDDVTFSWFVTVFELGCEAGGKTLTERSQEGRLVRLDSGPATLWRHVSWRMSESSGQGLKGAAFKDTAFTFLSCFVDAVSANPSLSYLILFSLVLKDMWIYFFRWDILTLDQHLANIFHKNFDLLRFLDTRVWPPILCLLPPQLRLHALILNKAVHRELSGNLLRTLR